MTQVARAAIDDLAVLLPDWKTHLRARNIASSTIGSYLTVGANLPRYLDSKGMPRTAGTVRREHLGAFLADLSDRVSPATVAKHNRSPQQLFRWLAGDDEITASPMDRMQPPQVPEQPVDIYTDDELTRLLASAKGNTFENRRDTALRRMLVDTGMRASELIGLAVTDLDDEQAFAHVMGKGRRARAVPYGNKTADALRRYRRVRLAHSNASLPASWLGKKGALTVSGLAQALERRGAEAGVEHVHPHRFRHTYAHTWLASGGKSTISCAWPAGAPHRWSAVQPDAQGTGASPIVPG